MLYIKKSKPWKSLNTTNVSDFVVGEIELYDLFAVLYWLDDVYGIELQLDILNIKETLYSFQVCDRFKGKLQLFELWSIL